MFRTDSSLKGVARRESNRPGVSRSKPTTNNVSSGTSSSRADGGRDEMVEKAKIEREEREWKRKVRVYVVRIQSIWRQYRSISVWFTQEVAILNRKLEDVAKIATAFAAVGVTFVPPAATSQALLLPFSVLWSCQTRKQRNAALLGPMKQLLELILMPSLKSNDPKLNFLSRPSLSLENINSTIPRTLQIRVRRLLLSCLEIASHEINSSCASHVLFAETSLVDTALSLVEMISKFPEPSLSHETVAIAPAVLVSTIQVLRVHLILKGELRKILLTLPEPRPTHHTSGLSSSNNKVKLGGCNLSGGAALQDRIQMVLSRVWNLAITAIECAPPAPRPSPIVIESFAKNILSIPLLLWREDGRDFGRLVAASESDEKGPCIICH